jgi:cytochrome c oxidase subunit 3
MDLSVNQNTSRNKIHPYKFALWVGCASLVMMFAALSSAYLVRMAAGNWLEFSLPDVFKLSTAVIVLSSLTLHGSYVFFKKENKVLYQVLLFVTMVLGILFFVFQYQGWQALKDSGVPFTLNPSGDFVYVISWLHAAHVLGGMAILAIALLHAFALRFRVTPRRLLRFELTMTYWHFVDVLWVYLFIFLTMYR